MSTTPTPTPTPLPESPNDFPFELHSYERWLRNTIVTLGDRFDCVDIHWEVDHAASEASGETVGTWDVHIEAGRKRISAKHPELLPALWYCATVADAASTAAYEAREAAREKAMAKLDPEDRKLLGLRP